MISWTSVPNFFWFIRNKVGLIEILKKLHIFKPGRKEVFLGCDKTIIFRK